MYLHWCERSLRFTFMKIEMEAAQNVNTLTIEKWIMLQECFYRLLDYLFYGCENRITVGIHCNYFEIRPTAAAVIFGEEKL